MTCRFCANGHHRIGGVHWACDERGMYQLGPCTGAPEESEPAKADTALAKIREMRDRGVSAAALQQARVAAFRDSRLPREPGEDDSDED